MVLLFKLLQNAQMTLLIKKSNKMPKDHKVNIKCKMDLFKWYCICIKVHANLCGSIVNSFWCRVYFRIKMGPTSGCCPQWLIFLKSLFYQNNCNEAMNIGGGEIRGTLCSFFVVKKCPFLYLADTALNF